MIFSYLYNFLFLFLAILFAPKICYDYFFKKKYKTSLKHRLGFDFPKIDKKNKPLIWIHAVSLGETRAIIHLAELLSREHTLLISSITETGHAEAKRSLSFADYHVYLPIDLKWVIDPIIKQVQPNFVIISETDLWFQFLSSAKKQGAKTVLVNGKVSEKSAQRLKFFHFFTKRLYSLIDLFLVQSDLYKKRFLSLGVPLNQIEVTGNLKFDGDDKRLSEEELVSWKKKLGIEPNHHVVTIGSTHHPEEVIILNALDKISDKYPHFKIILVPRHPERFDAVEKELLLRDASFCRFSKNEKCTAKIVLVDAMGFLLNCYQVADVAVVGGSFTHKIGGHNILEPLSFNVPVVFGPYMHSQPDLLELVLSAKAGIQTTEEELSSAIDTLLSNYEKKASLKKAAAELTAKIKGSTKKTFEICQKLFHK